MGLSSLFVFFKVWKLKFLSVMDIILFNVVGNDVQLLFLVLNIMKVNWQYVRNKIKNISKNDIRGLDVILIVSIRREMCWLNFNKCKNFNIEKNIVMFVVVDIYLFMKVMY